MSLVQRLLPDNPVLTKELRSRMRGARAYWIMFGYIAFLSLVLWFSYYTWSNMVESTGGGSSLSSEVGNQIFMYVLVTQIFLVLFITPAITSGSLTIEREQRTMDMLDLTPMKRRSIIVGKLLAAVAFTALLIISSLPLISICFMLGSVDPAQVLSAYLEMLLGSFFVGAMGLMWSSIARTTTQAVSYTYITMFMMVIVCCFTGMVGFQHGSGEMTENVVRSIGSSWFSSNFFGLTVLDGTGFVVMCVLGGFLMACVARVRLEMFPERKGWILRGMTLLLLGVELMASYIWWLNAWYHRSAQAVQSQVQPPTGVLLLTTILLMLVVPIFATGELKSFEARRFGSHLLKSWTPQGLMRGKLVSGLPFLLLLTTMALALYGFAFVLEGKAGEINAPFNVNNINNLNNINSAGNVPTKTAAVPVVSTVTPPLTRNGKPQNPATPPKVDPLVVRATSSEYLAMIGGFPQIALLLFAFVMGFSVFCLLLSVLFRNRWVAWMLANLTLIAIWIVPSTSRGNGSGDPANPLVNLYYLNPLQAIYQITEPVAYMQYNSYLNIKDAPMWRNISIAWLAIGALSFLFTLLLLWRERSKSSEIPFEEMVANA